MTTTTDSLKGSALYRCEKCRARVAIVAPLADRRLVCIDCLPPKQQAVFRSADERIVEPESAPASE